jgi:type III restriction enzyme
LSLAPPETDTEEVDDEDAAEERPPRKLTKDQQAERLRRIVDTVGRLGEPGADVQHVVSVGMLTEGWDARTVTHIMGLRAFTSQLLCEQVVGRGLRRTSYEVDEKSGLFEPEYVNVFGIPFTFLPHEGGDTDVIPPPPKPKSVIAPDPAKVAFEISSSRSSTSSRASSASSARTFSSGSRMTSRWSWRSRARTATRTARSAGSWTSGWRP